MLIKFTKMHGLGNDFMVLDLIRQHLDDLSPELVRRLADRKTGIGFDQLLIIEAPQRPDCDFRYRIYNADGSEVEHCGNGARCLTRFALDQGLALKEKLCLEMYQGFIETWVNQDGTVTVDMGEPILSPADIPFVADHEQVTYTLQLPGSDREVEISAVSMGNPHAVLLVDDMDQAPVEELGPLIEPHPRFPKKVNVGFMEVVNNRKIRLRVYERGAGETLACGTGACAAVVAGRIRQLLDASVDVELRGGKLQITWEGKGSPLLMTGTATTVFEGQIEI